MAKKATRKRLRVGLPRECPWGEEEVETALRRPEFWLRGVEIEDVAEGQPAMCSRGAARVRLPGVWDSWRQLTHPPSFIIPEDIERTLTAKGIQFARRRPRDSWTVTIPYAWVDF